MEQNEDEEEDGKWKTIDSAATRPLRDVSELETPAHRLCAAPE
jgi:hypothetical protein